MLAVCGFSSCSVKETSQPSPQPTSHFLRSFVHESNTYICSACIEEGKEVSFLAKDRPSSTPVCLQKEEITTKFSQVGSKLKVPSGLYWILVRE
jgi:hypothetical protein